MQVSYLLCLIPPSPVPAPPSILQSTTNKGGKLITSFTPSSPRDISSQLCVRSVHLYRVLSQSVPAFCFTLTFAPPLFVFGQHKSRPEDFTPSRFVNFDAGLIQSNNTFGFQQTRCSRGCSTNSVVNN